MDYLKFEEDMVRLEIRSIKAAINIQRGLFYFNIIIAALNGYFVYTMTSLFNIFNAVSVGALIINFLWIGAQLFCLKQDLKLEKQRLANFIQLRDNENYKGVIQQYENARRAFGEDIMKESYNKISRERDTIAPGLTIVDKDNI